MNKSDLRTGMIVRCKNGKEFTVDAENKIMRTKDGHMSYFRYDENLLNVCRDEIGISYDIIEVIGTIWKRKPEPKRMTKAEIETALGHPIEVVQEVREIKRRAKIYEHIKIVKQGLHVPNLNIGDIHRVINVDGDGSIDTDKENVFSGEQHDEYVVLLGYQPEATHE
jgi:glutaredoxin